MHSKTTSSFLAGLGILLVSAPVVVGAGVGAVANVGSLVGSILDLISTKSFVDGAEVGAEVGADAAMDGEGEGVGEAAMGSKEIPSAGDFSAARSASCFSSSASILSANRIARASSRLFSEKARARRADAGPHVTQGDLHQATFWPTHI